jgi:serine/threonine protein kinase
MSWLFPSPCFSLPMPPLHYKPQGREMPRRSDQQVLLPGPSQPTGESRPFFFRFACGEGAVQDPKWPELDSMPSLRDSLSQKSQPIGSHQDTCRFIIQTAKTLSEFHRSGALHLNLNPRNIRISPSGAPLLSPPDQIPFQGLTADHYQEAMAYRSPEQIIVGRKGIDHRSDIFSLGVILYELLVLRPPFADQSPKALALETLYRTPCDIKKSHPDLPSGLSLITRKSLEKAPESRYQSMAEFAEDLACQLAGKEISAKTPSPMARTNMWLRNWIAAFGGY